MTFLVRAMEDEDKACVLRIYGEGIDTGQATFTSELPTWEEWDETYLRTCRFVATQNDVVTGWAALKSVSTRTVYSGVTDISIYVAGPQHGNGIGKLMMASLIERSEAIGIWTIRAHMFPESQVSERLHRSFGFKKIGICEKAGKMENGPLRGVWRDVLLMERRSSVVGIE